MGLRVRAVVTYEFQCPQCRAWLLEGNPLECPHREGRGVKYKPKKDGPVINAKAILRKLGLEKPIEPVAVQMSAPPAQATAPEPRRGVTIEDALQAECPKGG